jgi:hypothetical protein
MKKGTVGMVGQTTVQFGTLADGDTFLLPGDSSATPYIKLESASFPRDPGAGHPIASLKDGKGGPNINDNDDVIAHPLKYTNV